MIVKSHDGKEENGNQRQTVYNTVNNMRRAEETMRETSNEAMRQNLAEKNSRRAEAVSEAHAGFAPSEEENP